MWHTLFNYPADEKPQKISGLHDAKDRRQLIFSEISNMFLRAFIISVQGVKRVLDTLTATPEILERSGEFLTPF